MRMPINVGRILAGHGIAGHHRSPPVLPRIALHPAEAFVVSLADIKWGSKIPALGPVLDQYMIEAWLEHRLQKGPAVRLKMLRSRFQAGGDPALRDREKKARLSQLPFELPYSFQHREKTMNQPQQQQARRSVQLGQISRRVINCHVSPGEISHIDEIQHLALIMAIAR